MTAISPVIECQQLSKVYENGVVGLKDLNLTIEPGTSFGLMGENGAGKSTLVRLLLGFVFPTSGELRVLGQPKVQQAHPQIGYLHERSFVELRFTGRRYLSYMAQLSGLAGAVRAERVTTVLKQVDLEAADKRLATYSKGMLQRISIAQSLLTDPRLLVLDEPTGGLDPYSQWMVREIIQALRVQGKTIFLCSHYLTEVQTLCDMVGILQRGKLVRYGKVAELLNTHNLVEIVLDGEERAESVANRLGFAAQVMHWEEKLLQIPAVEQSAILAVLIAANVPIRSLNPVSSTVEEVYLQTTHPKPGSIAQKGPIN